MVRPVLEVADILRNHGPAWREANRDHVSLDQLKVMSAIERCRTAALGGHVARCENAACGHTLIMYNSCRNRHCPKCQAAASPMAGRPDSLRCRLLHDRPVLRLQPAFHLRLGTITTGGIIITGGRPMGLASSPSSLGSSAARRTTASAAGASMKGHTSTLTTNASGSAPLAL